MSTRASPVVPAASPVGGSSSGVSPSGVPASCPSAANLIATGHVSTAYGLKGWVWVHALTDPVSNIFGYQPWYLKTREGFRPVKVLEWRTQGKGVVARLDLAPDRTAAEALKNLEIWVPKDALPELEEGDYYWSDLIDLEVRTESGQILGVVDGLMETGSNDVVVVKAAKGSMDDRERVIPWLPGSVVKNVDLVGRVITVDWDPEF
ncbi:MAG: ribosome maturation factor RimM [bacterium]|nr:ribosome maturation factor RimM [bacterium]